MVDLSVFALPLAAGLRNVAGWAENALADKKVEPYEWGQLGATLLRVTAIGFAVYLGMDYSATESAGLAVVGDFLLSALTKKNGKK